jgi:hypothetical protein
LEGELNEDWKTPQMVGTNEDLQLELDNTARDVRDASAEASCLNMQ